MIINAIKNYQIVVSMMISGCITCDSNYKAYDHKCYPELPNCSEYDDTGCITCECNYELYDHECYSEITNCSEYDNNGCITCDSTDFELYNHKCY